MKFINIIIILCIVNCYSNEEFRCQDWKSFVENPNLVNYRKIKDDLNKTDKQQEKSKCIYDCLIKKNMMENINNLIAGSEENAIRLSFDLRRFLMGFPNIIENFDISVGKTINTNPAMFLKITNEYVDSGFFHLNSLLTNYGTEFVDNYAKQLKVTNVRISKIKSVENNDLKSIKEKCINELQIMKAQLEELNALE